MNSLPEIHLPKGANSLSGKTVIVTGAARGLGREIAHGLARHGAHVAVVDLDLHSFEAYRDEASSMIAGSTDAELRSLGHDSRGYEVNLADSEATRDVMRRIAADFGGTIDALVCNAGGGSGELHGNTAGSLELDSLDSAIQKNLHTTVNCATAVVPMMRAAGRGSIVTMASINGLGPTPDGAYAHYGVSKAAVIMYTKYLARDVGPSGIRANVVAPGTVPTARIRELWETDSAAWSGLDQISLRRRPELREISDVVRFLVSDESSFVSGQTLTVDGG